ncbi:MAG TPA: 30S ribosomal protein S5 [Patescibacteria group bacterium]|nr:30S ribosomal protein S5 [Patescibacteria group bacterium]
MAQQRNNRRGRDDQQKPEVKEFDEHVVNVDRVARVVKGGRRFRFRALVVVGDKKGRVGIGISKGADVTSAVTKSVEVAKKNLVRIILYKETIPHEVEAKVGGSQILIKPASAGTGLIAGGVVRTILETAGVRNALSKSLGSSNKLNTAYATLKALNQLSAAKNWVTNSNNMVVNNKTVSVLEEPKVVKKPAVAIKTKIKSAPKTAPIKRVKS